MERAGAVLDTSICHFAKSDKAMASLFIRSSNHPFRPLSHEPAYALYDIQN